MAGEKISGKLVNLIISRFQPGLHSQFYDLQDVGSNMWVFNFVIIGFSFSQLL